MRIRTRKRLAPILVLALAALSLSAMSFLSFPSHFDHMYDEKANRGFNFVPGVQVKAVALTIDDGPDARFSPRVLKILREKHATATFFLVGQAVIEHPELAKEIAQSGNEIGNHTLTHPQFDEITFADARYEIREAEKVIFQTTGVHSTYVRAPRGDNNPGTRDAMHESGLIPAGWTVGLENHNMKTPEKMARRVMKFMKPGAIILMHDGRLDRTLSIKALPILLDKLHEEGYEVMSLRELVALSHGENLELCQTHPQN